MKKVEQNPWWGGNIDLDQPFQRLGNNIVNNPNFLFYTHVFCSPPYLFGSLFHNFVDKGDLRGDFRGCGLWVIYTDCDWFLCSVISLV